MTEAVLIALALTCVALRWQLNRLRARTRRLQHRALLRADQARRYRAELAVSRMECAVLAGAVVGMQAKGERARRERMELANSGRN